MPVPTPNKGEEKQEFISRCMGDSTMVKEYEQEQRAAICYSQWTKHQKGQAHVELRIGGKLISESNVEE